MTLDIRQMTLHRGTGAVGTVGAFCIRAFGGAPRVKRYRILDHQIRRSSIFRKQNVQEVCAVIITGVISLNRPFRDIARRLHFFR